MLAESCKRYFTLSRECLHSTLSHAEMAITIIQFERQGNDLKIESDPERVMKTLSDIENSRDGSVVPSSGSSLPPLEAHHGRPRPTTPDVIAMVSSIQEECAPGAHPPPPPLHNPAANPPPLFAHSIPPQMPQIGAPPTTSSSSIPPTMKRWNK